MIVPLLMYMCMYDAISPPFPLVGLKIEEDTVTEDLDPGNEHKYKVRSDINMYVHVLFKLQLL